MSANVCRQCTHAETLQRQNEARDTGSLQADFPRPCQADRSSGGLPQSGDSGACRLRCPSIGGWIEEPTSQVSWSASCAPIWKTTPRRSRSGESCNPSTQIYQRVYEQYAHQASSNRLNAWHAVITGETPELYQSVTTVMQDVSLFPQTALAPPASQPEGGGRNHIRSHRPKP